MFLKVPFIIVMRFGKDNVFGSIYINFGGGHLFYMFYLTFIVYY